MRHHHSDKELFEARKTYVIGKNTIDPTGLNHYPDFMNWTTSFTSKPLKGTENESGEKNTSNDN